MSCVQSVVVSSSGQSGNFWLYIVCGMKSVDAKQNKTKKSEKISKSKIIRATHSLWNLQKYITRNLPPSYSCTCGNHNPPKQETNNEETLTCHKLILSIQFHQLWRCRNWLDWIPLQVIEFCSSRLFSFLSFISVKCTGSFFPFTVVLIFNPWYSNGDRYILVEWNL